MPCNIQCAVALASLVRLIAGNCSQIPKILRAQGISFMAPFVSQTYSFAREIYHASENLYYGER